MRKKDERSHRRTAATPEAKAEDLPASPPPLEVHVPSRLPIELPKRYRFRGLLGKGGMGRVYEVDDLELGRTIALKVLVKDGEESRHRFLLEAQVMAQLEHPNILPCYDFDADPQARLYYTMRKVEGMNLRVALDQRPAQELLPLLAKAARGIAHAHQMGIVHRDVKPNNVMLGGHGEVWVVDWGLVGARGGEPSESTRRLTASDESVAGDITQEGAVVGTLGYLAPEQLHKGATEIGPPADVHGLGAILYKILTGQKPYPGETGEEIVASMQRGPPVHPGPPVPPALAAIAMKALAVDPADRYPSAAEFARDLEAYLGGRPVSVFSEPSPVRVARWVKRHPIVVAAVLVGVLGGGGLSSVLGGRARLAADARRARDEAARVERDARIERATAGLDEALEEARRAHDERMDRLADYSAPFERVFFEPERIEDWREQEKALRELNLLVFQPSLDGEIARANDLWQSASAEVRGHVESLREAGAQGELLARSEEAHRQTLAEELEWSLEVALATERATIESRWIEDLRRTALGNRERVPPFYLEAVRLTASMAGTDRLGAEHPSVVRARRILAGRGRLTLPRLPEGTRGALVEFLTVESPFARRTVVPDVPVEGSSHDLPLGSYVLEVRRGHEVFPFPVLVERERETSLEIELPAAVPEGTVWIPPGDFLAGGEAPVSWPRHERRLTSGFLLQVREVTVEEFRRFRADAQGGREAAKPAAISLDEAEAYAAWLTAASEGFEYFVPTESQWERAARGSDGRLFVWGDEYIDGRAGIALEMTEPPGTRLDDRTIFGVLDLTGNMHEWCLPRREDGRVAVLRGGAYSTGKGYASIPSRNPEYCDVPERNRGFRLAARPRR